jgi:hypothetical protein
MTKDCCRLDGMRLAVKEWQVQALDLERVESSFFDDQTKFPKGSVTFVHALLMRDIVHEWHGEPDRVTG